MAVLEAIRNVAETLVEIPGFSLADAPTAARKKLESTAARMRAAERRLAELSPRRVELILEERERDNQLARAVAQARAGDSDAARQAVQAADRALIGVREQLERVERDLGDRAADLQNACAAYRQTVERFAKTHPQAVEEFLADAREAANKAAAESGAAETLRRTGKDAEYVSVYPAAALPALLAMGWLTETATPAVDAEGRVMVRLASSIGTASGVFSPNDVVRCEPRAARRLVEHGGGQYIALGSTQTLIERLAGQQKKGKVTS